MHAAAQLLAGGGLGGVDVKRAIETDMDASIAEVLPGVGGETEDFINSDITCPGDHAS